MKLFEKINHTNLFFNEKFDDFKKTMEEVIDNEQEQAVKDILTSNTSKFLKKNPNEDTIYKDEFKKTIEYFSRYYQIGSKCRYQCYCVNAFLPWHIDEHMNEIGCIIIPLNKNGKGIVETIFEVETFTRTYTETIYLNTTFKHKINLVLTDYVYLRIPIMK
jgi:hypothetical protein